MLSIERIREIQGRATIYADILSLLEHIKVQDKQIKWLVDQLGQYCDRKEIEIDLEDEDSW